MQLAKLSVVSPSMHATLRFVQLIADAALPFRPYLLSTDQGSATFYVVISGTGAAHSTVTRHRVNFFKI